MKLKEVATRFFDGDKELAKFVALTEKEIEAFEVFEDDVYYSNGLKYVNGAVFGVTVYEVDEDEYDKEDNPYNVLLCEVTCGSQDEDGSRTDKWNVTFNRKTLQFEKD